MKHFLIISTLLFSVVLSAPSPGAIDGEVAAAVHVDKQSPISFDHGNVGVNFGGYHASAGLGGLLSGDAAAGGLHAEAGTPHGQAAGAGLGGVTGGKTAGGLFAGATAGGGVSAAAGAAGGVYGQKTIHHREEVIAEKTYSSAPKVVHEETIQERPTVSRTVIEKTVIPQYVEKTIQVPTYVEKTIRVPTVVEHKVRVPVTPKVVEKTYDEKVDVNTNVHHKQAHGGFSFGARAGVGAAGGGEGFVAPPPPPPPPVHKHFAASATVGKSPGFINDVFAIPINTLGAVSNLLGGIAGRGSVSVSKSYGHV